MDNKEVIPGTGKVEVHEPDKIERAEMAVKRMEEAEKRLDEKISKLTELETNRLLGSSAGGHVDPVPVRNG